MQPTPFEVTGLTHILPYDIMHTIDTYECGVKQQEDKKIAAQHGPGAKPPNEILASVSRLEHTYSPLVLTTCEKIVRIFLICITFGIWRCYQNYKFRKALYLGGEQGIQAAIKAVKLGASYLCGEEDLPRLASDETKTSVLEWLAAQPDQGRYWDNFLGHLSLFKDNLEGYFRILDVKFKYGKNPIPSDIIYQAFCWIRQHNNKKLAQIVSKHGFDAVQAFQIYYYYELCLLEFYLDNGLPPNQPAPGYGTLLGAGLQISTEPGESPYIRRLLEHGADPNAPCIYEIRIPRIRVPKVPLMVAILRRDYEHVKLLIEFNATPTADMLFVAAGSPNARIMKDLLDHAANHHIFPTQAEIMRATEGGNLDTLSQILIHTSRAGVLPTTAALEHAIKTQQVEVATLLMQHGAPISADAVKTAVGQKNVPLLESMAKTAHDRGPEAMAAFQDVSNELETVRDYAQRLSLVTATLQQNRKYDDSVPH